jgi:hypothetical protein
VTGRSRGSSRKLTREVFEYEAKIDGEWGCCHGADEIAGGLCPEASPDDMPAIRLLRELEQRLDLGE